MEQNTKGSGFLKVSGILLIIFGVLGIIFGIVGLILNTTALIIGSTPKYISSIFLLLDSILGLIAGIVGVVNANKPEKSMVCIIWGIIVAAVSVLGSILTAFIDGNSPVFALTAGLVLPILFIVGGLMNKQGQ